MKRRHPLWVVLGLVTVVGCGDGPSTPSESLGIQPAAVPSLHPGDEVQLSVADPSAAVRWQARDLLVAQVTDGLVEAFRPGTTWVVASTSDAADSVLVTVTPRPGGYTAEEVDYFVEIAPGFEYGGASEIIRKWREDIRLRVNGEPDASDLTALDEVVAEINALTDSVDIVLVTEDPLVELHFAPTASFPDILPSWVPGNVGYFTVWWGNSQYFTRAVVLIATDVSPESRKHLIREEVTQILGLGNDSHSYANSIFYQLSSNVTEYAPVDRAVIEILYRPQIQVGMGPREAARTARRLLRRDASPWLAALRPRLGAEGKYADTPGEAATPRDGPPGRASGGTGGEGP